MMWQCVGKGGGGELEWEKSYMYYAGPDCREGQQENIYN